MKKIIAMCVLFLTCFPVAISASDLGTLNYWHSHDQTTNMEYGAIARWKSTPNTKHYSVSGFSNSTFLTYVNAARNSWRNAGISINSTSSDQSATLKLYGGTLADLQLLEPSFASSFAGFCNYNDSTFEGTWNYNNKTKYGLTQNSAKVFVLYQGSGNSNYYTGVTIHETGHALGWRGHSQHYDDIMYHTTNSVTTLTSRDKNHLIQVY